jgi:hypothetical protein
MEYFLLPRNRKLERIEIPYICSDEYDGGPFLSYPERQKFEEAVRTHHVWCIKASEEDVDRFNSFLQNWLCFGLLSSVFGRLVTSDELTQVRQTPFRKVLDSTNLVELSNDLVKRGQSWSPRERQVHNSELMLIFKSAHTMLSQNLRGHFSKDVDHKLVLFLSLLYESLFVISKQAFGEGRATQLVKPCISSRQGSDFLIARLKEDGWCPREIQLLISRFNTSFRYFANQLDRPGIRRDHNRCLCTALHCKAYDVDPNDYNIIHTTPDCSCEHVTVDSSRLFSILERKVVPAVQCVRDDNGKLSISLIEANPDTTYVAISHVWSDGYGNPKANSMPYCQIEHMNALSSIRFGAPVPFWLDTLCCPVEPQEATDLAISLMRKTYEEASHVIVLDSWLHQQESADLPETEMMMRIALSAWTRRLWTFQEGILAKELWFRFSDNLIDIDLTNMAIMKNEGVQEGVLKAYLLEEYLRIRGIGMAMAWDMRDKLPVLADSLQYRSTSVPTDEALCIGALLNLDMSIILAEVPEERMRVVWGLISNIPSQIVFLDAPKLTQKGFRWAPASFFGLTESNKFGKMSMTRQTEPSTLTEEGLMIKHDGFIFPIGLGAIISEYKITQFEFLDDEGNIYWVECTSKMLKQLLAEAFQGTIEDQSRIYKLTLDELEVDMSQSRVALVVEDFNRPLLEEDASAAILALVKDVREGVTILEIACHAAVQRSRDPSWHPAIPLAQGRERPVNYLTSRRLDYIKHSSSPYAGTLFEAERKAGQKWIVD